ncbi:MAG: acyltransferase [Cytophagales bacterium]|nr:MAG: acyltransferase [Cytophagales bacterium]
MEIIIKKLNPFISLYLDLIRTIAAFGVLLVHANIHWFSNNKFLDEDYGHKLVMVFFVLSGYLISYSTRQKERNLSQYINDRVSRLYSIVIPALIFTYLIDGLCVFFHADYMNKIPENQIFRVLLNIFFLDQNWSLCSKPSTNGPFWSISYEFWYYMIYGVFYFVQSYTKKWLIILGICLFIGPKILLLFPVWILGVAVQYIEIKMPKPLSIIGFIASLTILIMLTINHEPIGAIDGFIIGQPPLYFSSRFLHDYIYGIAIAVHFIFLKSCSSSIFENFNPLDFIKRTFKATSNMTFTLYLFHLPILILFSTAVNYDKENYFHLILMLSLLVIFVYFISTYLEKSRIMYKNIGNRVIQLLGFNQ